MHVSESGTDMSTVGATSSLSEAGTDKRRGRPKAWHAELAFLDGSSKPTTLRGKQNFRLQSSALATLTANWRPDYAWFWYSAPIGTYDELKLRVSSNALPYLRSSVLTEIGRLRRDEDRLALADALVALPLSTKTRIAVGVCRRWRLSDAKPASDDSLIKALVAALNEFLVRHPDTSYEEISEALDVVAVLARERGDDGDADAETALP